MAYLDSSNVEDLVADIKDLADETYLLFIDLGEISRTTYPTMADVLQRAYELITTYNKPIAFKFTSSGQYSGIAYKYTATTYGTIEASGAADGYKYFGWMVNNVFYCRQVATQDDLSNAFDVTSVTFSASVYPNLTSNAVLNYNRSCATITIRGVKNLPSGNTLICSLPAGARPHSDIYEDYVTSDGNHFRIIITTSGSLNIYNYQSSELTDNNLQKVLSWVV